ncbi:hypothetical protein SAY87_005664 [Trapa incisa]|uniref:Uncharacterized protein n=1 Tax=Trapa incisa TaxID=236973 RepID=A0AAN7Q6V7_9MYRT|nr:hypothetical protein SAY87_005664 [Trapa incisa]
MLTKLNLQWGILLVLVLCFLDLSCACTNSSFLVGLESEIKMVQHQLRGIIKVIDDCSFRVSQFDMLSGSDVHWWGASAVDFDNITAGFIISDQPLNQTYKNQTFDVRLRENVTWDQIRILAIWDMPSASDLGHLVFPNASNLGPSPSPSPGATSPDEETIRVYREPTMFDNCKTLSKNYRVRWTLDFDQGMIDIGLEAATGTQNYMAFGFADPKATSEYMIGADVAFTGFTEEGLPFSEDYFITGYTECTVNKDGRARGVCPDTVYEPNDPIGSVNNTALVYGHRRDGVSFIRYQRKLDITDKHYDLPLKYKENVTVIWALGLISPPDSLRPYYLPHNHGGEESLTFGHLALNVSEHVNDCLGPIDSDDTEDQALIIADANAPLVVTTAEAVHYPNPPNPSKVLYINKKEAPVLRVERGVPVKFSIQAGHDVALYITSDPLGGNATLRNKSEIVYVGGPLAEGVPANPMELTWAPDRNTPDLVYYHSLYQPKMGWRVHVVDGGLSDMYSNNVLLDDQQVTLFWTLSEESISLAARGEKKSGYIAIGFGSGMMNSFAYVGWVDANGTGRVNTYWIDGQDAMSIHPTNENLTYVRCKSENGIITMEFTRTLKLSCGHVKKPECNNIVDPTTPLKVVWAMGSKWTDGHLTERNMHSVTSQRPVRVLLMRGTAEAEQDLRPVLAVHGFMMFLAWGILLPSGIMAARYLKHVKGDGWFKIHVYLQYCGLAIVFLGLLFAVAELRGFYIEVGHVKFGLAAIILACMQPVNGYFRPKRPTNGGDIPRERIVWEYFHAIVGRCSIPVGIAALISGMKQLGERYGDEDVHGLDWALMMWFLIGTVLVLYLEYCEQHRKRERLYERGSWVLGNSGEDDSADLLSPTHAGIDMESHPNGRMEVQLEPLSR